MSVERTRLGETVLIVRWRRDHSYLGLSPHPEDVAIALEFKV